MFRPFILVRLDMLDKLVDDFPNLSIHIKKVDVTNQVVREKGRETEIEREEKNECNFSTQKR